MIVKDQQQLEQLQVVFQQHLDSTQEGIQLGQVMLDFLELNQKEEILLHDKCSLSLEEIVLPLEVIKIFKVLKPEEDLVAEMQRIFNLEKQELVIDQDQRKDQV